MPHGLDASHTNRASASEEVWTCSTENKFVLLYVGIPLLKGNSMSRVGISSALCHSDASQNDSCSRVVEMLESRQYWSIRACYEPWTLNSGLHFTIEQVNPVYFLIIITTLSSFHRWSFIGAIYRYIRKEEKTKKLATLSRMKCLVVNVFFICRQIDKVSWILNGSNTVLHYTEQLLQRQKVFFVLF